MSGVQLYTDIDVISGCLCVLTLFNYFLFFLIACVCCYHLMVDKRCIIIYTAAVMVKRRSANVKASSCAQAVQWGVAKEAYMISTGD